MGIVVRQSGSNLKSIFQFCNMNGLLKKVYNPACITIFLFSIESNQKNVIPLIMYQNLGLFHKSPCIQNKILLGCMERTWFILILFFLILIFSIIDSLLYQMLNWPFFNKKKHIHICNFYSRMKVFQFHIILHC